MSDIIKQQARNHRVMFMQQHSELSEEVQDLYILFLDNIEEGESPQNELNLFINSCNQLLEDECND
jgi:hypothetical protein